MGQKDGGKGLRRIVTSYNALLESEKIELAEVCEDWRVENGYYRGLNAKYDLLGNLCHGSDKLIT